MSAPVRRPICVCVPCDWSPAGVPWDNDLGGWVAFKSYSAHCPYPSHQEQAALVSGRNTMSARDDYPMVELELTGEPHIMTWKPRYDAAMDEIDRLRASCEEMHAKIERIEFWHNATVRQLEKLSPTLKGILNEY